MYPQDMLHIQVPSRQADKQPSIQATKQLSSQVVSHGQTNLTAKLPDCDVVIQADDEGGSVLWAMEQGGAVQYIGIVSKVQSTFF